MFVYSVTILKYKAETLSGIGAEKFGGRWNEPGTRAVYCSENISLALLEWYVHSSNMGVMPKEIGVARIYVPDHFNILSLKTLPENWNSYPYTSETTSVFTKLVKQPDFFALKVPSSIVGLEHNVILNPLYHAFGQVRVEEFIPIPVDKRFIKHL